MSRGLVFWIVLLLWLIVALIAWAQPGGIAVFVAVLLLLVLIALLGWQVYGSPLHMQ